MWYFSAAWQQQIALDDGHHQLTYAELAKAVQARQAWLEQQNVSRVALFMDNGIEWVLFDLACQQAKVCCVPVPVFFSAQQTQYLLQASAIELLLVGQVQAEILADTSHPTPFSQVFSQRLDPAVVPHLPLGTHKITFTSGTTGTPKGVCLSNESQLTVARSLASSIGLEQVKHLCLLPLATLLENIAGIYAPLMVGGTVYLASQTERGFQGSRLVEPQAMLALISQQQPNSVILVPELLSFMVLACNQGWQPPTWLQFIAVGGGKVSAALIEQARALGLPVYQGYGLSECASVVSLNTPEADQASSAGKLLPHAQVRVENGELIVSGNLFLGYMNQPESFYPTEFASGDLVRLEDDFLTIEGRRKNVLINSFGRNISPEWVEAELLATQCFRTVMVFGDAQPFCGALLVLLQPDMPHDTIQAVIDKVNSGLPDYAQIGAWLLSSEPLEHIEGLVTSTGKLIRKQILAHFDDRIQGLYQINQCANY
ncbi:Long-chain-fatty-acid--CoA ligase FadD15 [Marinomonas aquimarina]|uniref:Long-chain-fatty-acid--CoA ligase FadD15 n=1 Tax=Marinomonas aquimarina TaxID=295068 RepID=A0A1A8T4V2_9GAMM|nr:AMP-binding protein [Marinomonas aquimarina]SBS26987.1 Long-chain-fatty-acid--CoA ligase FadD15 [Marinomonas aquimarina]